VEGLEKKRLWPGRTGVIVGVIMTGTGGSETLTESLF
jgi:hypothetical protein